MKNLRLLILAITLLIGFASCDEKDENKPSETETPNGNTSSVFGTWARNDGQASAYLKIEGTAATTCSYGKVTNGSFNAGEPSVSFNVGGVTHTFKIIMSGSKLILRVPATSTNPNHVDTEYIRSTNWPCGGNSGGDGGTGGGGTTSNTGNVIFWTQTDHGCGPITVTINNQSGSINSYYGAAPACGANGGANFTLPAGNYSYTAKCAKYQWSSSITITAGGCIKMKLN